MRINNKLKLGFLALMLSLPMLPTQMVVAGQNEQRAPPTARTAGTLGTQVVRAITQIQEMMTPEDPEDEPDLVGAKEGLDRLYERRYERMNDFEKQTILNFYTNYYLTTENYPEAIKIFEQLLTIEALREDTRMRSLLSLGQLQAAEENWRESINAYVRWRELSFEERDIVYRGLSYGHYQIEEFAEAEPYWISYMELLLSEGAVLDRGDYSYLVGIYFTLEDYDKALELTKSMIVLFDESTDWINLSAIYAGLDEEELRIQSMNLALLKGHVNNENRFLNLGQSMAGIDIAFSGAAVIEQGIDEDVVEQTDENMTTLTQMYLIASEYEAALEPAIQAAELTENGDGYDTLGYIHYVLHDYDDAADAFKMALEKGELSNRADTLLFLARSLIELDDFDGASEAAKDAAEAGNERDQKSANDYLRFVTNTKTRFDILATRRREAIDFYRTYPKLQ